MYEWFFEWCYNDFRVKYKNGFIVGELSGRKKDIYGGSR